MYALENMTPYVAFSHSDLRQLMHSVIREGTLAHSESTNDRGLT